ncbi:hypothetical protein JCM10908_003426 [Rhodotorula pacifica]|uniref:uncharacterized protein n=1 Tax=Rhodotorula pacifica TaxID=1495444 RepID=UPI0031771272
MVVPLSSPTSSTSSSSASHSGRQLPASTSESALVARARLAAKPPPAAPPPAQPKRVRPFILRARNAASATAPARGTGGANSTSRASTTPSSSGAGPGQLRKSQTSFDLEARAGTSPTKQRRKHRDENVPPLPPLPGSRGDVSSFSQPANKEGGGSPTRVKRIARPISLATNSLRALGSGSSSSSKPAVPVRRRPLSYVVSSSSPPRTRTDNDSAAYRSPSASPTRSRTRASADSRPSLARRASTAQASTSTASRMSALPPLSSSSNAPSPPRRALASPPHAVKTQSRHAAVELHKSALKRKTLEERHAARSASPSSSAATLGSLAGQDEATGRAASPASSGGGMTRSRRWFGRFQPENVEDGTEPVSASHRDTTATMATQRELDAYATPPPPVRSDSVARKKAWYAALPAEHAVAETNNQTGFASLQELLEQHGYADTRVITPHSTTQTARIRSAMAEDLRADLFPRYGAEEDENEDEVEVLASPLANGTRSRSPSPGPKRLPTSVAETADAAAPKEIKERPSLLSLRGLFSFFGSSAVDVEEDLATSPRLETAEPSPPLTVVESEATPIPQRMRTVSEMHRWVETVNEVYPPPMPALAAIPASTATSSTAVMPELHFEHTPDDDDDAASSRSYSSSVSFSGSPPTPQPAFGEVDYTLVIPSSFSGLHLSPPMHDADVPRNKRLSLRHTVSDSNLLPSYQPFSGLGISTPSSPRASQSQLSATRPEQADAAASSHSGGTSESTTTITAANSAGASGLWGTTLLRARASQLFSLAMARSPVDAATGRSFFTMPSPSPVPSSSARSPHLASSQRAPPKLLRKAVSSAGLVSAPQVRRTRVVTKASWESFGSLEAKVSIEGGRPGSTSSGGAEGDLDGGIGWGEDLLGRAWA